MPQPLQWSFPPRPILLRQPSGELEGLFYAVDYDELAKEYLANAVRGPQMSDDEFQRTMAEMSQPIVGGSAA